MGVDLSDLPERPLVLLDSAPIIYVLDGQGALRRRFEPLFEAHAAGRMHFAISSVTIAEVLTGPLKAGDEALAKRYKAMLESWDVVPLDADIAESAARLRASLGFKLPDAIQAASALAVNADALITHDRDFSRLRALRVIS
ncbi:MAG: PIN domain-containing protein [Hyphomonadaceae bacterium]|nr:PIN domain-containing protein [Hyphomonadaceae bacterium]